MHFASPVAAGRAALCEMMGGLFNYTPLGERIVIPQ
jgi:hypothetical protein